MKLVSIAEMKTIEAEANQRGLTYAQMMENAGKGLAEEILNLSAGYAAQETRLALALVGPGNNGGDALVALTHLIAQGWQVCAWLENRPTDALTQRLLQAGGQILSRQTDPQFNALQAQLTECDVIVDGLLGTGFHLPLRPEMAEIMNLVNAALSQMEWPPFVAAVDCPSGVDCDSGQAAAEVIPASLTVCMAAIKHGLLSLPAFELAGELRLVSIGLSDEPAWQALLREVPEEDSMAELLPARPADAHKGTFGTAVIAAGSINYTGAALLAGKAAYRAGAGLVQMAVPGALHAALAGHLPEATWTILPSESGVIAASAAETLAKTFERATALLLGPGLGTEETTAKFIENLLTGKAAPRKASSRIGFVHSEEEKSAASQLSLPPLVIDADGLRLLAKLENWTRLLPAGTVLTPHPGEMAVLTGMPREEIQADRQTIARKFAAEWGQVVVLKGAFTVIAAPDGRCAVLPFASAALARAGTGDVLAGIITGLRAQGLQPYQAAVLGAWLHAEAGMLAAEAAGSEAAVLAGDLLETLGQALGSLRGL